LVEVERKSSVVVNIRLDRETLTEVDAAATSEGRSRSNMLARLIKAALEARPRKREKEKSRGRP
jgi:metal-responsive CopG/Arc/MetJ family transcriptional regulator